MKKSIYYYKKLTGAEVGNKGTHEHYIRLPNNFDYKTFFHNSEFRDGTTEKVAFNAFNLTRGHESPDPIPLTFVYYVDKNGEKRIPSLNSVGPNIVGDIIFCIYVICVYTVHKKNKSLLKVLLFSKTR